MPRLLTNLKIDEVSSVDRGAGKGVRALILKHDQDTIDKALTLAIGSIITEGGKAKDFVELFKQFHSFLGADSKETDMKPDEIAKLVADTVAKALLDAGVFAKMTPEHAAYHQNLDGDEGKRFQSMGHDDRAKYMKEHPINRTSQDEGEEPEETGGPSSAADAKKILAKLFGDETADKMMKAVTPAKKKLETVTKSAVATDIEKALAPFKQEIDALKKRNDTLENDKAKVEFGKRAVTMGLAETDGEKLLKAHRGDPEALKWMEETIGKLSTQISKGDLFKEFGSGGNAGGDAHEQLVAKAGEIRKRAGNDKLTVEAAYVKAMEENPEIAKQEKAERDRRINKLAA